MASITPGPTNLISLLIGTRAGILAAIPFILGSSISAALILWLSGVGLASVVLKLPLLKTAMSWGGALWISYLSWEMFFAFSSESQQSDTRVWGCLHGVGLQIINPKTWMMTLSAIGIFSSSHTDDMKHISVLAGIFFLVAIPSLLMWSYLGKSLSTFKGFSKKVHLMNKTLALLLFATAWSAVLITGKT